MIDDATLLERYANERSEEAFAELVQRHLTLVYSAALRRTGGDTHRAKDVAQIVFTALAREARELSRHAALTGWLYAATRNAAIDLVRAERRRQLREEKAHIMEEILSSPESSADWEQLRPVLDEAMDELDARDREAVLLRFFEGKAFAGVASVLRVSEDAARKRVDRALEKLGGLLARRGITSTGGALAALLANQTSVAAPAGVAASITAAAMAGAAVTGAGVAGAAGIFIMSTSKIVTGITAVVALAAIGTAVYQANLSRTSEAAVASISAQRDELRAKLGTIEKRAQQSDEQLAATQKELADARAAAVKPVEQPAAARPAAPSQGVAMDYVLDHPETHPAFIEEQSLRAKARYDRFFKTAGLSAEQQDKVLKDLKEVRETELDLMVALRSQGLGVGNMPQDPEAQAGLTRIAAEQKQRIEAELRSTLGPDGFKAFQQYSAMIPERNVTDQLASQLYYTDEPLTAQQANQLAQILAQNRFTPQPVPSPANTMNGTVITQKEAMGRIGQAMQQGGMTMLDWAAPVTDTAIAKAEAVLTPGQLAALKRVQAQQVAQFQIAPPPGSTGPRKPSVPAGGK